jgi:hypothetical protein
LKYKKKKNGKQKFCDTDCDSPDSDNGCDKSWFVDTCRVDDDDRDSVKFVTKKSIDEGFVKLITKKLPNGFEVETMYYTPFSTDAGAKLFATELIHLGSVFDCDWQGIPKLQPYLTSTSYKRPPYTAEYLPDNTTKIACGMTSTGGNGSGGLFFDIDCVGLTVGQIAGKSRCNNLKRICEHGVNIDESLFDSNNNVIAGQGSDCYINDKEIVQPWGDLFRDVFAQLNYSDGPSKLNSWPITGLPLSFDTSLGGGTNAGGVDYLWFRSGNDPLSNSYNTLNTIGTNNYRQPKNSFYFYFGTAPNRSAVDLMNRKYFTECEFVETNDFVVSGIITDATGSNNCDGEINTTVVGGDGPYTYVWSGPNGFSLTETVGDITGLCAGNYTVTVTDDNGGTSTITFTVNAPADLSCIITANDAINAGGNGDIVINAFGGLAPYSYSINGNPQVTMASSYVTVPQPAGTYVVTVYDQNGATCTNPSTGVTITQPPALSLGSSVAWTHTTCGSNNGSITVSPIGQSNIGGVPPYSFSISGTSGAAAGYSSPLTSVSSLASGTYVVTVTDGSPIPQVDSQTVTINPSVTPTMNYVSDWYCWSYPSPMADIDVVLNGITANGSFTIQAVPRDASNNPTTPVSNLSLGAGTTSVTFNNLQDKRYDFYLTDSDGCTAYAFGDFRPGEGHVPLEPLRLEIANPSDKYCWVNGVKEVQPKLQVWADGPFVIIQGLTVIYSSPGVPAGSTITLLSTISVNSSNNATLKLKETTHNCELLNIFNFNSQLPSSELTASASQTATVNCAGTTQNGTVTASPSGGYGSYTYRWYRNGIITSNTSASATVTGFDCGTVWKCKITDNEGCIKWTNNVTIT